MEKHWAKALEIIKDQLSAANFRTWFGKTKLVSEEGGQIIIAVPSAFIKQQLLSKYQSVIDQALIKVFNEQKKVDFKIDPSLSQIQPEEGESELDLYRPVIKSEAIGLNPKYNIENFVVGLSNNLAFAAAQAVIQNPGISYNPLFIYGGTGVGKTHLMHAIGNALLKKTSTVKTIYCSSEKFMNDFIESIQSKRTNEFRRRYRAVDLLLIDDIQFISGRDSTQEEFFHTFNELQGQNSQIVLTSDRPPNEIQKVESRLVSRFQGGLTVDIQSPDFDTRVAILKAKCQERSWIVPEECLISIAEIMTSNARELEGKLIQIIQTLQLSSQPITPASVQALLSRTPPTTTNLKVDHKKVLAEVNQYFNIRMADITGPRRKKELVLPRQLAMLLLYEECKLPYQRIGEVLGGRDHTTIMHGVDKMRGVVTHDREISRILSEIKEHLLSRN